MTAAALLAALALIPSQFTAADPSHDAARAQRARVVAAAVGSELRRTGPAVAARRAARLQRTLAATRVRLQPWPLPQAVRAQARAVAQLLPARDTSSAEPYGAIDALLAHAAAAPTPARARAEAIGAYALFEEGPARRLRAVNGALAGQTDDALWRAVSGTRHGGTIAGARTAVQTAATALGDVTVSRTTVVADAGVIVFREGLEAVLILAAITASFTGTRRRLRRPVLMGALCGLLATAATYAIAQTLVDALGDGGQRLQAITGVLAIAVLLIVTNWFFHRIYWSEWIGRFNRRRKMLEHVDRLGFISGQTAGFVLLGLTSVYREGFETVLFLQNLQVSAGTGATILGVAIGLAATLLVGSVTFLLERKLPYRRMLIATGVLIGLVLAIMTGVTVHSLPGLGSASSSTEIAADGEQSDIFYNDGVNWPAGNGSAAHDCFAGDEGSIGGFTGNSQS